MNEISYNSRIAQYAKLNKISEEEAKKQLEQQGETYEDEQQSDIQNAVNDTEGSLSALQRQADMLKQGKVINQSLQKTGSEQTFKDKASGIEFTVTKLSDGAKFDKSNYEIKKSTKNGVTTYTLTIKSAKNCVININNAKVDSKTKVNVVVDKSSKYITLNSNKTVSQITNNANNSIINGSAGKDKIINNGKDCVIHAGKGADTVTNNGANSVVFGGEGNDKITNSGANSTLAAGSGNDTVTNTGKKSTISGGAGNDTITNNAEKSTIKGDEGNDSIINKGKNSTVSGGAGNDTITNNAEKSTIKGDEGNDSIINKGKNSTVSGGAGNDKITNNSEKSTIKGDGGNDTITNKGKNSTVSGNAGVDIIDGKTHVDGKLFTGVLKDDGKYYEKGLLKTGVVTDKKTNTTYKYNKGVLVFSYTDKNTSSSKISVNTSKNTITFSSGKEKITEEIYPGDNIIITKDGYVEITNSKGELSVFYPSGIIAYENGILYDKNANELNGYYNVTDKYKASKADENTGVMYSSGRIANKVDVDGKMFVDGKPANNVQVYGIMYSDGVAANDIEIDGTMYKLGLPADNVTVNDNFYENGKLATGDDWDESSQTMYRDGEKLTGRSGGLLYENGKLIPDGKYTITVGENNSISIVKDDENGVLYFEGEILPDGTYTVTNDNGIYTITPDENGDMYIDGIKASTIIETVLEETSFNGFRDGKYYLNGEVANNQFITYTDENGNEVTKMFVDGKFADKQFVTYNEQIEVEEENNISTGRRLGAEATGFRPSPAMTRKKRLVDIEATKMFVNGEVADKQFVTYIDENGNEVTKMFVGGLVANDEFVTYTDENGNEVTKMFVDGQVANNQFAYVSYGTLKYRKMFVDGQVANNQYVTYKDVTTNNIEVTQMFVDGIPNNHFVTYTYTDENGNEITQMTVDGKIINNERVTFAYTDENGNVISNIVITDNDITVSYTNGKTLKWSDGVTTPDIPDTPEVPDTPDVPDTPEVPDTPKTPSIPENYGTIEYLASLNPNLGIEADGHNVSVNSTDNQNRVTSFVIENYYGDSMLYNYGYVTYDDVTGNVSVRIDNSNKSDSNMLPNTTVTYNTNKEKIKETVDIMKYGSIATTIEQEYENGLVVKETITYLHPEEHNNIAKEVVTYTPEKTIQSFDANGNLLDVLPESFDKHNDYTVFFTDGVPTLYFYDSYWNRFDRWISSDTITKVNINGEAFCFDGNGNLANTDSAVIRTFDDGSVYITVGSEPQEGDIPLSFVNGKQVNDVNIEGQSWDEYSAEHPEIFYFDCDIDKPGIDFIAYDISLDVDWLSLVTGRHLNPDNYYRINCLDANSQVMFIPKNSGDEMFIVGYYDGNDTPTIRSTKLSYDKFFDINQVITEISTSNNAVTSTTYSKINTYSNVGSYSAEFQSDGTTIVRQSGYGDLMTLPLGYNIAADGDDMIVVDNDGNEYFRFDQNVNLTKVTVSQNMNLTLFSGGDFEDEILRFIPNLAQSLGISLNFYNFEQAEIFFGDKKVDFRKLNENLVDGWANFSNGIIYVGGYKDNTYSDIISKEYYPFLDVNDPRINGVQDSQGRVCDKDATPLNGKYMVTKYDCIDTVLYGIIQADYGVQYTDGRPGISCRLEGNTIIVNDEIYYDSYSSDNFSINYMGDNQFVVQGENCNLTISGSRLEKVTIEGENANINVDNLREVENNAAKSSIHITENVTMLTNKADFVHITGSLDDDYIKNEGNNVSINGNAGNDRIKSSGDTISINGGEGDDSITVYNSNNTISGGTGNDVISGGITVSDAGQDTDLDMVNGKLYAENGLASGWYAVGNYAAVMYHEGSPANDIWLTDPNDGLLKYFSKGDIAYTSGLYKQADGSVKVVADGKFANGYIPNNKLAHENINVDNILFANGLVVNNIEVVDPKDNLVKLFIAGQPAKGFVGEYYYFNGQIAPDGVYEGRLILSGKIANNVEYKGKYYVDGLAADGLVDDSLYENGKLSQGEAIYDKNSSSYDIWDYDYASYIDYANYCSDTETVLVFKDGKKLTGPASDGCMFENGQMLADGWYSVNFIEPDSYQFNRDETEGQLYLNGKVVPDGSYTVTRNADGTYSVVADVNGKIVIGGKIADGLIGDNNYIDGSLIVNVDANGIFSIPEGISNYTLMKDGNLLSNRMYTVTQNVNGTYSVAEDANGKLYLNGKVLPDGNYDVVPAGNNGEYTISLNETGGIPYSDGKIDSGIIDDAICLLEEIGISVERQKICGIKCSEYYLWDGGEFRVSSGEDNASADVYSIKSTDLGEYYVIHTKAPQTSDFESEVYAWDWENGNNFYKTTISRNSEGESVYSCTYTDGTPVENDKFVSIYSEDAPNNTLLLKNNQPYSGRYGDSNIFYCNGTLASNCSYIIAGKIYETDNDGRRHDYYTDATYMDYAFTFDGIQRSQFSGHTNEISFVINGQAYTGYAHVNDIIPTQTTPGMTGAPGSRVVSLTDENGNTIKEYSIDDIWYYTPQIDAWNDSGAFPGTYNNVELFFYKGNIANGICEIDGENFFYINGQLAPDGWNNVDSVWAYVIDGKPANGEYYNPHSGKTELFVNGRTDSPVTIDGKVYILGEIADNCIYKNILYIDGQPAPDGEYVNPETGITQLFKDGKVVEFQTNSLGQVCVDDVPLNGNILGRTYTNGYCYEQDDNDIDNYDDIEFDAYSVIESVSYEEKFEELALALENAVSSMNDISKMSLAVISGCKTENEVMETLCNISPEVKAIIEKYSDEDKTDLFFLLTQGEVPETIVDSVYDSMFSLCSVDELMLLSNALDEALPYLTESDSPENISMLNELNDRLKALSNNFTTRYGFENALVDLIDFTYNNIYLPNANSEAPNAEINNFMKALNCTYDALINTKYPAYSDPSEIPDSFLTPDASIISEISSIRVGSTGAARLGAPSDDNNKQPFSFPLKKVEKDSPEYKETMQKLIAAATAGLESIQEKYLINQPARGGKSLSNNTDCFGNDIDNSFYWNVGFDEISKRLGNNPIYYNNSIVGSNCTIELNKNLEVKRITYTDYKGNVQTIRFTYLESGAIKITNKLEYVSDSNNPDPFKRGGVESWTITTDADKFVQKTHYHRRSTVPNERISITYNQDLMVSEYSRTYQDSEVKKTSKLDKKDPHKLVTTEHYFHASSAHMRDTESEYEINNCLKIDSSQDEEIQLLRNYTATNSYVTEKGRTVTITDTIKYDFGRYTKNYKYEEKDDEGRLTARGIIDQSNLTYDEMDTGDHFVPTADGKRTAEVWEYQEGRKLLDTKVDENAHNDGLNTTYIDTYQNGEWCNYIKQETTVTYTGERIVSEGDYKYKYKVDEETDVTRNFTPDETDPYVETKTLSIDVDHSIETDNMGDSDLPIGHSSSNNYAYGKKENATVGKTEISKLCYNNSKENEKRAMEIVLNALENSFNANVQNSQNVQDSWGAISRFSDLCNRRLFGATNSQTLTAAQKYVADRLKDLKMHYERGNLELFNNVYQAIVGDIATAGFPLNLMNIDDINKVLSAPGIMDQVTNLKQTVDILNATKYALTSVNFPAQNNEESDMSLNEYASIVLEDYFIGDLGENEAKVAYNRLVDAFNQIKQKFEEKCPGAGEKFDIEVLIQDYQEKYGFVGENGEDDVAARAYALASQLYEMTTKDALQKLDEACTKAAEKWASTKSQAEDIFRGLGITRLDGILENVAKNVQYGVTALNIAANLTATLVTGGLGGGLLMVAFMAGATTYGMSMWEASTDGDGLTYKEKLASAKSALTSSLFTLLGMGSAKCAEKLVKAAFNVSGKVITWTGSKLTSQEAMLNATARNAAALKVLNTVTRELTEIALDAGTSYFAVKNIMGDDTTLKQEAWESLFGQLMGYMIQGGTALKNLSNRNKQNVDVESKTSQYMDKYTLAKAMKRLAEVNPTGKNMSFEDIEAIFKAEPEQIKALKEIDKLVKEKGLKEYSVDEKASMVSLTKEELAEIKTEIATTGQKVTFTNPTKLMFDYALEGIHSALSKIKASAVNLYNELCLDIKQSFRSLIQDTSMKAPTLSDTFLRACKMNGICDYLDNFESVMALAARNPYTNKSWSTWEKIKGIGVQEIASLGPFVMSKVPLCGRLFKAAVGLNTNNYAFTCRDQYGNAVAGMAGVRRGDTLYLGSMAVDKSVRNQGSAFSSFRYLDNLLIQAYDAALKDGIKSIKFEVMNDNDVASGAYRFMLRQLDKAHVDYQLHDGFIHWVDPETNIKSDFKLYDRKTKEYVIDFYNEDGALNVYLRDYIYKKKYPNAQCDVKYYHLYDTLKQELTDKGLFDFSSYESQYSKFQDAYCKYLSMMNAEAYNIKDVNGVSVLEIYASGKNSPLEELVIDDHFVNDVIQGYDDYSNPNFPPEGHMVEVPIDLS